METAPEREVEGGPTVGGELAAPAALESIESMYTPLERSMTALAAHRLKERFPEYAWANLDLPRKQLSAPDVEWLLTQLVFVNLNGSSLSL